MTIARAARTCAVALAVFAVAVVASGCGSKGGNKGTSPRDWANNLCSSLVTWSNSVASAAGSLKGNVNESSLKSSANDITKATDKLASDLKGLGKPNTQSGKKAKDAVETLSDELKSDVDTIEKTVKGVSKPPDVAPAVAAVSATLVTLGNQVRAAFTTLEQVDAKGELAKAFRNADSCKKLTTRGG